MKKKVMIAIGQLTGGGAERVATVWANELAETGYEVSMLTYYPSTNEYPLNNSIKVYRVAKSHDEYLSIPFSRRYSIIRNYLKMQKPDYIISFLVSMQVWMMLTTIGLHVKRIETIRINPWRVNVAGKKQKLLWKLCYTTCSKIILQSSDQAPFFSKWQQKKSVIIPNPISEAYVKNYKDHIGFPPTRFIAAGRIDEQKNYPMMIKAFSNVCKSHPELTLEIFGSGSDEYVEQIKTLILNEGMANNIFLMGRTNHIESEYKKRDIFLMTSDFEGLPNALAEAMASRLVCISTDCKTGPRDLIDNEKSGFLVPVNDVHILQKKIEEVIVLQPAKLNEIAENARTKILSYCSRNNSVNRLCEILK